MLDLSTLKQALAPLSAVGRDEFTFEAVEGMVVTLRPLLPLEEVAVQRFSAAVLNDIQAQEGLDNNDNMSRAAAMDYFDRFRIEIISNGIVQVNDLDLREEHHIATGEVLENGTPVRVPRGIAMRGIVEGWSRAMLTVCFARYGDLVQKIADKADQIAQTTLPDLDAEIVRVEARLASLKEDRETRAKGDPSVTADQITNLVKAGQRLEEDANKGLAEAEAVALLRKQAREALRKQAREAEAGSQEPVQAQAPVPAPVTAPVTAPVPAPVNTPVRGERKSVIPQSSPPPTAFAPSGGTHVTGEVLSSFGDGDDPEVVVAEEQRIMEARRRAAAARQETEGDIRDPLRGAVQVGSVDGVDAYRLPKEEVSPRGRASAAPQKKRKGEETSPAGTENPNFKPSR